MVSTPTRTTAARSGRRRSQQPARPPAVRPLRRHGQRPAGPPSPPRPGCGPGSRGFWSALEGTGKSRNGSTYYLILGSTLALTAIGIMMVLSASSVEAIAAGESPYSAALKQGGFAAIGVFAHVRPLAGQRRLAQALRLAAIFLAVRAAGPGPPRGTQRPRQPELDRRRPLHVPALRSRQACAGAVDGHRA